LFRSAEASTILEPTFATLPISPTYGIIPAAVANKLSPCCPQWNFPSFLISYPIPIMSLTRPAPVAEYGSGDAIE
jgi:hypothetical protein